MKRTHIMIAVFFACILSPNLLFPILKTTADEGTGENRSLAAFPTLSLETIDTFPSGVEDWINDYPREMFGWKTSGELFQEELARLA